jgi:histidinol dehydrogenase
MLRAFTSTEALGSILTRQPLDSMAVPPALLVGLEQLFGSPTTPEQAVVRILADVRLRGDDALRDWTSRLDGHTPDQVAIPEIELVSALKQLPSEQRLALETAAARVRSFHQAQPVTSWLTQASGGVTGQLVRPIRRVGLYVPAGSAPLPSTVLMSAIPAQVAGVPEIVLVTPPQRATGKVNPIILATAALLGIHEVYALGGAQAIGAMAYGTPSVPKVDKIFGPGNLFVTLAKRQVYGIVGIDGLAGPTETLVIADESARPEWIAADLLAQAEHDVLAAAILLTPSKSLISRVQQAVASQIELLGRSDIIAASLANRSGAVLTQDLEEAIQLANDYAPEHLCLSVSDPWRWLDQVKAAGGIFMGEHSFEVLGDYVAGPSHVMPTGGSARFASPLNVLDFVHLVSLIGLDPATTRKISPIAAVIAASEGLDGHANAARLRAEDGYAER